MSYIADRSVASGGFGAMGTLGVLKCPPPSLVKEFTRRDGVKVTGCCIPTNMLVPGGQQCCGPAYTNMTTVKVGTKYKMRCGTPTATTKPPTNTQPPSSTGGGGTATTDTTDTTGSMFDFSSILSGPWLTYGLYIIGGVIVFKIVKSLLASRSTSGGSTRSKKNRRRRRLKAA